MSGSLEIAYSDECRSGFGHDKSLEIRPYARLPAEERPVLFYAGDGVSDLSAAKETDLLFAKAGRGMLQRFPPPVPSRADPGRQIL